MQNKYGKLTTYYNSMITSRLINTTNWEGYVDNSYADYAIGAPTLEMWVASWNTTYGDKLKLYTNTNKNGYYVGTGSNSTKNTAQSITSVIGWENNKLYFPYGNSIYDKCWGVLLSSPAAYASGIGNMMTTDYRGSVNVCSVDVGQHCFRPLVHLKSGIQIQKVDGVWRIQ